MLNDIFSDTRTLKNGLDASWLRNEVILNNIANVDTPNYKRSVVSFEDEFKRALKSSEETPSVGLRKTRRGHRDIGKHSIEDVKASIREDTFTQTRMDGSNVDMDVETTELARNYIYYQTVQNRLNSEYSQLNMAIKEGR